jgi:Glycosyltransferase family 92
VLQDYIDANIVVYHDVSGTGSSTSQQLSVYNDCINSYKKHHKWIAFIDVDEFIVVPDQKATIPSTLQRFDRPGVGGVVLNWRIFGSSGWDRRPKGGIANYYKCVPYHFEMNTYVKSIVNTAYVMSAGPTVHYFKYREGSAAVATSDRVITETMHISEQQPLYDIIYINHYAIKSKQDFETRARRNAAGGHKTRTNEWRDMIDSAATDNCPPLVWLSLGG